MGPYDLVTFDCYGTLIDWERGISDALRPVLRSMGKNLSAEEILAAFAAREHAEQKGPFRRYRQVLERTAISIGASFGVKLSQEEARAFGASVPNWPPFPDARDALLRLKRRFQLGIVSNVDDDLFQRTQARLGVDFDYVVTAEQTKSYKPRPKHWIEMRRRSRVPTERTLHAAQSLFHDIGPARALGYDTVWINRGGRTPGEESGATPKSRTDPGLEALDLFSLAEMLGA